MMISFTLTGAPRTKKNHGKVGWSRTKKRKVHLQSDAYYAWHDAAGSQIPQIRRDHIDAGGELPIGDQVHVRALFFRDADRGDLHAYEQALGDFLQDLGIITDDKLIESWDGTRKLVDGKKPRIEVEIVPFRWVRNSAGNILVPVPVWEDRGV